MKILSIIKNEKTSLTMIISGFFLIILSIILFLWFDIDFKTTLPINSQKFSQFGDFIGGVVGSIWALAGVLLFYIALTEQRSDIKTNQEALRSQIEVLNQQVKEFELQRKELESSRKVYEDQSRTLKTQQFESNFYSLLNVYSTIKDKLNNLDQSKDFFKVLFDKLNINYDPKVSIEIHHENMINRYILLFNENRGHLSHYFKCFYRIIKIIDSSSFDIKEKVFYAKILRSQLTDFEQLILYYNSHSIYGIKARPLILKYNMLKHTPIFSKPEFQYYLDIQKNYDILFFADYLNQFLTKHINESFELDSETEKIEERFVAFNCIVGIYFNTNIEIKVFCDKNLSNNNVNLNEDQFSDFILFFIYDRIILSTYLDRENVILTRFKTETERNKIYGVSIETTLSLVLNCDKY